MHKYATKRLTDVSVTRVVDIISMIWWQHATRPFTYTMVKVKKVMA